MITICRLQNLIVYVFVATFVFLYSYYIGSMYVLGDQIHYRKTYEGLASLDLVEGYVFYTSILDSREYGHFLLSWLASSFIDKDIFTAIANSFLACVALAVFQRWKASLYIAVILVLTNYYFVAMYFSAERLKFAFIFLALSFLYIDKVRTSFVFAILALITHAQTVIIYFSLSLRILVSQIDRVISTGRIEKWIPLVLFLSLGVVLLISDQLLSKFNSYYEGIRGPAEFLRIFIFFLLALWYADNKGGVIIVFIPLIMAVLLFGGDRVNMIGYFAFLYYALPVRRGFNVGVIVTTMYFAFGTIGYIENIVEYGKNTP